MKIGILTFWWTQSNYGQMLQAFALKTYLTKMGNDVFFIKYHGSANVQKKSLLEKIKNFNLKIFIGRRVKQYKIYNELSTNSRYFDLFRETHLKLSDKSYMSFSDLKESPPVADMYICGSDQVWNNNFGISCEPYLLGFGNQSIKRVAYAASFGVKNISAETKSLFLKYLKNFDAIGVREKSGVALCNSMGAEAFLMPDPTLLLSKSEWCEIINSNELAEIKNQTFVYTLGNSAIKDRDKFMYFLKSSSSKTTSFKHVSSNHDFSGNIYPTVFEWLKILNESSFVFTNSFHGIVFCLIFNKNFVIVPNTGIAEGMNERITSLLSRFDLLDNIMDSYDEEKLIKLMNKNISWSRINIEIKSWQDEAKLFINNVISK